MSEKTWPETLTKEQFINALEQFLAWAWDMTQEYPEGGDMRRIAESWVEHMDSIVPCWPAEDE